MTSFAMLLKSFSGDREYAERLVASFHQFNREDLHLYCVVPEEDLESFGALQASTVTVLSESLLKDHLVTEPLNGYRVGYINQEIIKLSFWELGLADNYFCVDSDAVFIRDFSISDFMADAATPFTVLVEDRELQVEPQYFAEHWQGREANIRLIADCIGLDSPVLRTCHGHQIFSGAVLQSFAHEFLAPRGWDYRDALAVSPLEFSWYNLWLQHTQVIPIHQREPYVKVFHNASQHLEYILRGVAVEDISRAYLAVVINSNYSRDLGVQSVYADKPRALAPYLSYGELAKVLGAKLRDTWQRRITRH